VREARRSSRQERWQKDEGIGAASDGARVVVRPVLGCGASLDGVSPPWALLPASRSSSQRWDGAFSGGWQEQDPSRGVCFLLRRKPGVWGLHQLARPSPPQRAGLRGWAFPETVWVSGVWNPGKRGLEALGSAAEEPSSSHQASLQIAPGSRTRHLSPP